ncbi:MAG: winged helix-turn-helix transcriptional regulator [Thermoplasmata archaeon]|nr:winged helix-turn-helix transcriptional regulator [Candidatus Sysuiplasma acidicola]MBX8645712.1 winged helix-turn-helix transcriptional regulator [Candidatus Sysuiplasma acidicola]MDH2906087.1 winged helix-turn-helix transcriptional regulator [Methanomassiliicoccales archaeon]
MAQHSFQRSIRGAENGTSGFPRSYVSVPPAKVKALTGNRRKILQLLYSFPASSVSRISREVKLTPNTVKWHLNALKKWEFINEERVDNRSVFFPCNFLDQSELQILTILNDESSSLIFRNVFYHPGTTQKEIREMLELTQNTAGYFLRKLTHMGAVEEKQDGKFKHYYPSREIMKRLEERRKKSGDYAHSLVQRLASDGVEVTELKILSDSFSFTFRHRKGEETIVFDSNPFRNVIA